MNISLRLIVCIVCGWWLQTTIVLAADPGTSEAWVDCKLCRGTGIVECRNRGCANGQVLCPSPCLKKETGTWIHLKVDGHPDTDLWQKFTDPSGSSRAWTQAHVGERIELVNGSYVNTGKCATCKGSTRIACPVCHGDHTCKQCKGTGRIPASAKPKETSVTLTPFKTKDGTVYLGTVVMRSAAFVLIKTNDGKTVKLATGDLVDTQSP